MIAAWVVSLLALTRRVYFAPTNGAPGETVAPVAPASAYFAILLDSIPVGLAAVTIDTLPDALRVTDVIDLRLPLDSGAQRYVRRGDALFSRGLRFRSATVRRTGGPAPDSVSFTLRGDSLFVRRFALRPGTMLSSDTIITAARPTAPASALGLPVVFLRPPRVGGARDVALIDPESGKVRRLKLSIVAESSMVVRDSALLDSVTATWESVITDTVRAWHVVSDRVPGPDFWIDEHGLPLHGELRPGLVLMREPFEVVSARHRAALAVGGVPGVRPPGVEVLRSAPPQWRQARMLVSNSAPFVELGDSAGPQRRVEDTLIIEVAARENRRPEVVRALGFARTAQRAGPPEGLAARTLRLARAAGVEARVVAGLVADGHGRWNRHNWVEVKANGSWIGIDPAQAQPVTAAYIRLVTGRTPGTLELLSLASRLNPRVLSFQ